METHVAMAQEEGVPPALLCLDGEAPPDLDGLDYRILGAWSEATPHTHLAKQLGVSLPTLRARVKRPAFQGALDRLKRTVFDQIARGEYGAMALLKQNQVGLVQRLLTLTRSDDEKVALGATVKALELSGMTAPKPVTVEAPERLLDKMTPEELEHFSRTMEIPARLAHQVARVAVASLQHLVDEGPPQRKKPQEVDDDDE